MQTIPLTQTDMAIARALMRRLKRCYWSLCTLIMCLFLAAWFWLRQDMGKAAYAVGLILCGILAVVIASTMYLQLGPVKKDLRARVKHIALGTITRIYTNEGKAGGGTCYIALQLRDTGELIKWLQLSQRYLDLVHVGDEVTLTWLPHSKHVLQASFTEDYVIAGG